MPQQRNNYNEETKEILGKLPSWIVRWGMTVIFVIFVGVIIGSCIIKYPQVVTASITITTINPPSDLIAKSTGRIDSIFAEDGQLMHPGEAVALLHNTASYNDVMTVAESINRFELDGDNQWINDNYRMGELQNGFSELRQQYASYQHYIQAANIPKKRTLLANQIAKYKQYLNQLRTQKPLIEEDYEYTVKNFKRDSLLHAQKVTSALEFERSAQAKLQKKNSLASFESSLTTTELSVLQMEQQLFELEMQYDNDIVAYKNQIAASLDRLAAQIKQWQQTYLLESPINGRLSYTKYWSSNQNVQAGEKLATVVPLDSTQIVGIMSVPSAGFGRVEVGQRVNVKLNGFPYMEYGLLKGVVTRISSVPDVDASSQGGQIGYIAEVSFPNGLQSSYKEQLKLIQRMDGTGDIITRDQRLIARFIQPIRALFDKISD